MSRYVLVEFEDDEAAEKLRKMIDAQTAAGKRYRVAGIFARPKGVCQCPRVEGYHKALVVRGRRFGWNTCVACKKAKPGAHRPNNLLSIGELLRMPGTPPAHGYEYRVDTVGIFEVPIKNIKEEAHGG